MGSLNIFVFKVSSDAALRSLLQWKTYVCILMGYVVSK